MDNEQRPPYYDGDQSNEMQLLKAKSSFVVAQVVIRLTFFVL